MSLPVCNVVLLTLGLDFLAHSNYIELALIEMGERDIFPHVGRRTQMRLRGARHEVYPCVTGTFGGVDFLHSVTGEGMYNDVQLPVSSSPKPLRTCLQAINQNSLG